LDKIVDQIVVPVKSSILKKDYPKCNFTCEITNLPLVVQHMQEGVALVLALVVASKPDSADMLREAAARIENASEKKQKVNLENGNAIIEFRK